MEAGSLSFARLEFQPQSGKRSVAHGVSHGIALENPMSRGAAEHSRLSFAAFAAVLFYPLIPTVYAAGHKTSARSAGWMSQVGYYH